MINTKAKDIIFNSLKNSGLKQTPFRVTLLSTLMNARSPLTAAQIFDLLQKHTHNSAKGELSFDRVTLFRNLKVLSQKDILSASSFGTGSLHYEIKKAEHTQHHAYCVGCKKTLKLKKCSVKPMIREAQRSGYQILSHKMELLGFCSACA